MRKALALAIAYSFEQKVIPHRMEVEELLHPASRDLV
jgi:hypothetical protein